MVTCIYECIYVHSVSYVALENTDFFLVGERLVIICGNRSTKGIRCPGTWSVIQPVSQKTYKNSYTLGNGEQGSRVSLKLAKDRENFFWNKVSLLDRHKLFPPATCCQGHQYPWGDRRARKSFFNPEGCWVSASRSHLCTVNCISS